MIDVSLKARLGKNKEKIVLELEKQGAKIKKGKESIDRVFIKSNFLNDFKQNQDFKFYNDSILEIRKEDDKTFLCLKKKTEKDGKFIKLESLVSDEEEIVEIIKLIGFEEIFEIKKKRTKYLLKGLSINIDYIENLDYFIEINTTVSNEKEEDIVRINIENIFESVGIKKDEYILDSYESLMYKNRK